MHDYRHPGAWSHPKKLNLGKTDYIIWSQILTKKGCSCASENFHKNKAKKYQKHELVYNVCLKIIRINDLKKYSA